MSDELRQAAERLIDPGKAGRVPDDYAAMIRHADQFWEDARAVAAAWLAEHPDPPAFTLAGVEALRRATGEIDTDAVRKFRGEPDEACLRAAAEEAVAWLESRPDWTEGDAATASRLRAALARPADDGEAAALDMVLHCPACGCQHVDAPEPGTDWDNPPHRSHKCHKCGTVWRPADVPTNGVAAVRTRGKADTWPSDR